MAAWLLAAISATSRTRVRSPSGSPVPAYAAGRANCEDWSEASAWAKPTCCVVEREMRLHHRISVSVTTCVWMGAPSELTSLLVCLAGLVALLMHLTASCSLPNCYANSTHATVSFKDTDLHVDTGLSAATEHGLHRRSRCPLRREAIWCRMLTASSWFENHTHFI